MDNNRTILIVSYNFPPSLTARALQLAKLLKYVSKIGVSLEIVTSQPPNIAKGAESPTPWFDPTALEGVKVHYVKRTGPKWLDRVSSAIWSLPHRGWLKEAKKYVRKLISTRGTEQYACVMTCAHPMESHCIGLDIRRKFPELPWIAHLSDPWSKNPIVGSIAAFRRVLRCRLENQVFHMADKILFVGDQLRDFVMNDHPDEVAKAEVLYHVFDPELYTRPSPVENELRLAYVGGFSKVRCSEPLRQIIRLLVQKKAMTDRLRIVFVGKHMDKEVEALNGILPGVASSPGQVGYLESLRYMEESHGLLLIDANLRASPYFPSKLADYFGSLRPTLAISPGHSCTSDLLRSVDMPVFDYDALDACADYLADILSGVQHLPEIVPDGVEKYSAENQAARFLKMVQAVQHNNKASS